MNYFDTLVGHLLFLLENKNLIVPTKKNIFDKMVTMTTIFKKKKELSLILSIVFFFLFVQIYLNLRFFFNVPAVDDVIWRGDVSKCRYKSRWQKKTAKPICSSSEFPSIDNTSQLSKKRSLICKTHAQMTAVSFVCVCCMLFECESKFMAISP